ncbi:MAG: hypothetical protein WBB45_01660 [Cyclobacteriaceae bacterium]
MPAEEIEKEGNPIKYTVGKPKSNAKEPANYYKDVRYVMDRLLEIELLSAEAYAVEYPTEPQEVYLMYPTPAIIHIPSPFLSYEDIPETIKAINEFQTDIIGWTKSYSRVDAGLTTIQKLEAATAESVIADREKVKRDRAAEAQRQKDAERRKKEQARRDRIAAEKKQQEAARIQAIRDESTDEANAKRIYEEYEGDYEGLGRHLVEYAIYNPLLVESILDYTYLHNDNIAKALVSVLSDSQIGGIDTSLLKKIISVLDVGWTTDDEYVAIERINRVLKSGKTEVEKESNGSVAYYRGALTIVGEGNDAQTSHVHWPNTESSGVTMGKGYDLGSREKIDIERHLIEAGFSSSQVKILVNAAGLKGKQAGNWVRDNKDKVGNLEIEAQYNLFRDEFERQSKRAEIVATSNRAGHTNINARGREIKQGKPEGTFVLSQKEWDNIHPVMKDIIIDLKYRGGDYGWSRVEWINTIIKNKNLDELGKLKAFRNELDSPRFRDYTSGVKRRQDLRISHLDRYIREIESGQEITYKDVDQESSQALVDIQKEYQNYRNPIKKGVGNGQVNNSNDVQVIQTLLRAKGYSVNINGEWNERCQNALNSFQQKLVEDGIMPKSYADGILSPNGTTIAYLKK